MRALVVGLGHMGCIHRDTLADLGYQVHTVDTDAARGSHFSTIEQALLEYEYDIAAVVVPIDQLVECAFKLAGIPMLVEKPFAPTAREAAMLGSYLSAKAPVCVGYLERFNPRVREVKERLLPSRVHVRSARFIRYSDRPSKDPVRDLLTHDVDLARYLLQDKWGERTIGLCSFDYACNQKEKVRRIELDVNVPDTLTGRPTVRDETWTINLMDHNQKPLYALYYAFRGKEPFPVPDDAVAALLGVEAVTEKQGETVTT